MLLKKIKIVLLITSIILVQIIIGVGLSTAVKSYLYQDKIIPGTTISGVPVGGLSSEEALTVLKNHFPQPTADSTLLLSDNIGSNWKIKYGEIKFNYNYQEAVNAAVKVGSGNHSFWHIENFYAIIKNNENIILNVEIYQSYLKKVLKDIADTYNTQPQNAKIAYLENKVVLLPETVGKQVDIAATIQNIMLLPAGKHQAELVVKNIIPSLTSADLKDINILIGRYDTIFDSEKKARTHNITIASEKINNLLIKPGAEFSFNQTIGARLSERGFKKATIIIDQGLAQGYGGGICQVSSTLFNAVFIAGLPVLERHTHTILVNYVPVGKDAAIANDVKDFRFKNDGQKAIFIASHIEKNRLIVKVFGHYQDAESIEHKTETVRQVIKPETVYKIDKNLRAGEVKIINPGKDGYDIKTYEITIINGMLVERKQVAHQHIEPEDALIMLPPQQAGAK